MYPDVEARLEVCHSIPWREFASSVTSAPDTCPGPSGISSKLLKSLPAGYLHGLWRIANLCLAWGALPKGFNRCYIHPIPKKGVAY